jgi:hypothetical protein
VFCFLLMGNSIFGLKLKDPAQCTVSGSNSAQIILPASTIGNNQCSTVSSAPQTITLTIPPQQQECSTPVVTSTPINNGFNPIITACDYYNPDTECCFWGNDIFPKNFFINAAGNIGRDFIVINSGGNYFTCDCDGNAGVTQTFSNNALWIPEKVGGKVVSLRSYFGGYLGINKQGQVSCAARVTCEENQFQVILSSGDCAQDAPNFILLKSITGMYLDVKESVVNGVSNLYDNGQIFKNYNWDANTSACKQPVVTSQPSKEDEGETKCYEVEVEDKKVKRKKHHKKESDCGCD